jgi:hypothetical protein
LKISTTLIRKNNKIPNIQEYKYQVKYLKKIEIEIGLKNRMGFLFENDF